MIISLHFLSLHSFIHLDIQVWTSQLRAVRWLKCGSYLENIDDYNHNNIIIN